MASYAPLFSYLLSHIERNFNLTQFLFFSAIKLNNSHNQIDKFTPTSPLFSYNNKIYQLLYFLFCITHSTKPQTQTLT